MYVADMTLDEAIATEKALLTHLHRCNQIGVNTQQIEWDLQDVGDHIAQLDTSAGLL